MTRKEQIAKESRLMVEEALEGQNEMGSYSFHDVRAQAIDIGFKMAEWADANPISETFTYSDQEHQRLERSLERIASMCGAPDAAEACRNIIKEVKRVLATTISIGAV